LVWAHTWLSQTIIELLQFMTAPTPDRRSQNRIQMRIPVSIKDRQSESVTGYTRDLSMSGIFLYTNAPLVEGGDLEMILMLPPELTRGEKQWVCCHASVVRIERQSGVAQIGVAADIHNIAALPEIPI
jgi:hypothetical protein